MNVELNVSGFLSTATFSEEEVATIHLPLLERITALANEKKGRFTTFLCAPPGTGKSTLAAFWEHLSVTKPGMKAIQALPLDGFHYPNNYLKSHSTVIEGKEVPLNTIKGAYQTFDLNAIHSHLGRIQEEDIKWPYYDRNIHAPVANVIAITNNILLIEGNWLLLKEPGWDMLIRYADLSIFIDTKLEYVKERLITRKMRNGVSRADAEVFFENSDAINVRKVLADSAKADILLRMNRDGSLLN